MAIGADISPRWQAGFSWPLVDHSDDPDRGLRFVWIKVSDGGAAYDWEKNKARLVAGAASRGIPAGGYAYCQPESIGGTPEHQAQTLAMECTRLNLRGVAPMLDLEEMGTVSRYFGERAAKHLASLGWRPAVYMNSSSAKAIRPDLWDVPDLVIVIARYGNTPEAPGSAQYLGRYDVHQFTSGGIRGGDTVDLDRSVGNDVPGATPGGEGNGDMDSNQDQLLREVHVELTDAAAPIYPGAGHISIRAALSSLSKTTAELIALVRAGSGVTAAELSAALVTGLTPVVSAALANVQADDPEQFAKAVTDRVAELMKGAVQ